MAFSKQTYLLNLDANNLYGIAIWLYAKSYLLMILNGNWIPKGHWNPDYYLNIPEGRGCIIEYDFEYTDSCKEKNT